MMMMIMMMMIIIIIIIIVIIIIITKMCQNLLQIKHIYKCETQYITLLNIVIYTRAYNIYIYSV